MNDPTWYLLTIAAVLLVLVGVPILFDWLWKLYLGFIIWRARQRIKDSFSARPDRPWCPAWLKKFLP